MMIERDEGEQERYYYAEELIIINFATNEREQRPLRRTVLLRELMKNYYAKNERRASE